MGAAAVCRGHLQPAHHPHPRRAAAHGGRLPPPHRPGDRAGWQLLPDVSPACHAPAGGGMLPAVLPLPGTEAAVRSRGAVPERVVPPLSRSVRGDGRGVKAHAPSATALLIARSTVLMAG